MTNPDTFENEAPEFAFVVPAEKYIYKAGGKWRLDQFVGKEGIKAHLVTRGWPMEEVNRTLETKSHLIVHGFDIAPGEGDLFVDPEDDNTYINTWVPPRLKPSDEPGPWPSVERVMRFLVNDDEGGYQWLLNWAALKAQSPGVLPKVAVVFSTRPGAGKGTFARIFQEILGEKNCETIGRENLESRFNTAWVGKLFVMADEVSSSGESMRDIKEKMKQYIDSPRVQVEGKGKDARSVPNHAAWVVASNDRIAPVVVEPGDRRYTIFVNHKDASEIRKFCFSLYLDDHFTLQPFFEQEVQNFWRYLLDLKVERQLVSRPYENDNRQEMIDASLPSHEAFINHVNSEGLDSLIERFRKTGELAGLDDSEYRLADGSYTTAFIYQCYREFCKQTGQHPLKLNKFGVVARSTWKRHRPTTAAGKRVWAYMLSTAA